MKYNILSKIIKNDIKINFKEQLKEINTFYKENKPKNLFKKLKGQEGCKIIEKMIYNILKKGYGYTWNNTDLKDRKYLILINDQIKKIIYDKNKVETEKKLPALKRKYAKQERINLLYDNEIINIKNVDYTKQGSGINWPYKNKTIFFINYFYQIIQYIIIAKINNWEIKNYFTLWLPRYNIIKRFNIDEKLINKWIKWYKVLNND